MVDTTQYIEAGRWHFDMVMALSPYDKYRVFLVLRETMLMIQISILHGGFGEINTQLIVMEVICGGVGYEFCVKLGVERALH